LHYSEGERHAHLKQLAKEYLQSQGFTSEQIFEGYKLMVGQTDFTIDVVGKTVKHSIAIEVGLIVPEKLQVLKYFFNQVIYLPYGTLILTEERIKLEMEKKSIDELRQQVITDPKKQRNEIELQLYKLYQSRCNSCKNKSKRPKLFRNTV
jgi:hypothetical protein